LGQAYPGEDREDRKRERPVSLILIHHQFKFKNVYSIGVIQLPEYPGSNCIRWCWWLSDTLIGLGWAD
jgi:hypothetical protein